MWWTEQVESRENHDLPGAVLHSDLSKFDATSAQVKQEEFAPVVGLQRQGDFLAAPWEKVTSIVFTALHHSQESIGFGLCQVDLGHQENSPRSLQQQFNFGESASAAATGQGMIGLLSSLPQSFQEPSYMATSLKPATRSASMP